MDGHIMFEISVFHGSTFIIKKAQTPVVIKGTKIFPNHVTMVEKKETAATLIKFLQTKAKLPQTAGQNASP